MFVHIAAVRQHLHDNITSARLASLGAGDMSQLVDRTFQLSHAELSQLRQPDFELQVPV